MARAACHDRECTTIFQMLPLSIGASGLSQRLVLREKELPPGAKSYGLGTRREPCKTNVLLFFFFPTIVLVGEGAPSFRNHSRKKKRYTYIVARRSASGENRQWTYAGSPFIVAVWYLNRKILHCESRCAQRCYVYRSALQG